MLSTWKKVKRSGTFRRAVQKEREEMVKRAREAAKELRKSAAHNLRRHGQFIFSAPPAAITKNPFPQDKNVDHKTINPATSKPTGSVINNANCTSAISMEYWDDEILLSAEEVTLERDAKLRFSLRKWATQRHITHMALKDLLKVINTHFGKMLPEDPRTLLETPQEVVITKIGDDGQYWHHGFEKCLRNVFRNINESKTISVNINMDGLPVFDSSKVEFWPILFNITEMPETPAMAIGIYCGTSKCSNLQSYLSPFVDEMKNVMTNGIHVNSHKITVHLRCFICDSPARAYVKGVANFNGQHGCQQCTTIGEYSYISSTNIFPRTECERRTDEKFRQKLYGSHHKFDSPLLKLDVDMVEQFPVGDSLHLLHLGIMKRLLFGWRDGTFRQSDTKWRAQTTKEITKYLNQCKMPAEFHRVVRGLDYLSNWKGTEYRTFLHYVGIVALKDHLSHELYEHFLLLFCSVTICTSKQYFRILPVARDMLLQFIEIFAEIYGEHHICSNVHNLAHLVDDVERLGELESFSAYPFENQLGKIKRLLRHGNDDMANPLAQVAKRTIEDFKCMLASNDIQIAESKNENCMLLSKRNNGANVPESFKSSIGEEYTFYCKVELKQFCLGTDLANCWFLTKKNDIACVTNIIHRGTSPRDVQLCCIEVTEKFNFFIIPIESKHFNIYCAHQGIYLNKKAKLFLLSDVKCKLVCLPYGEMQVFLPLLHTNCANPPVDDDHDE